jgi:hypothetical protein
MDLGGWTPDGLEEWQLRGIRQVIAEREGRREGVWEGGREGEGERVRDSRTERGRESGREG